MSYFNLAVKFVLDHEGGYVFNPSDPGGETKYGISKRTYPMVDIAGLTPQKAMEIYQKDYWNPHKLDDVPLPLCIAYFDSYVQHSPNVVRQLIEVGGGRLSLFLDARRQYYKTIEQKNPKLMVFDKGWMNRLNDLSKYCQVVMNDQ